MTLRVLSYNILLGGEDRLPLIRDVIRAQRPDVVALLEANDRENAARLAGDLGLDLVLGDANSDFHVAWLSRLPVRRAENHREPIFDKTLLEIEVEWDDRPLHLFAAHLSAGRAEDEPRRAAEVRAILDVLRPLGARPHLLTGDFNAIHPADGVAWARLPWKAADQYTAAGYRIPRDAIPLLLRAGYVDCYRALHPEEPGYTYKLPDPALRIDYCFASPALAARLRACDRATDPPADRASDHLPLWTEFSDER
jgi:endonuclease/exonuclease/phosphatase family metal-dependent hydrolase